MRSPAPSSPPPGHLRGDTPRPPSTPRALTDLRSEGAVVEAKAFLEGELLADVEIVFAHLDNSRANQIFGPKNFVFTQQLLGVLDLAKAQERAKATAAAEHASTNGLPGTPPAGPA